MYVFRDSCGRIIRGGLGGRKRKTAAPLRDPSLIVRMFSGTLLFLRAVSVREPVTS